MPSKIEQASAIKARAAQEFADLTRVGYTSDVLAHHTAKVYLKYDAELKELRGSHRSEEVERADAIKRKVYGADDLRPSGADKVAFQVSFRDAEDRASMLGSAQKAQGLLERALASGDDLLARAVAGMAVRKKWADVLDTYYERHPDYESKVEELSNATLSAGLGSALVFGLRKPDALRTLRQEQIEELAAKDPAVVDTSRRYTV